MKTQLDKRTVQSILRGIKYGAIFSVTFIKKDGSERKMVCRKGVKKGVTGKGLSYDPDSRNNVIVYDMQKKAFRTINLDTIIDVNANGDQIVVE